MIGGITFDVFPVCSIYGILPVEFDMQNKLVHCGQVIQRLQNCNLAGLVALQDGFNPGKGG